LFVFFVAFYLSSRHFALGIEAASFASGIRERDSGAGTGNGIRERDSGAGTGTGNGIRDSGFGISEQRYSGKPDGLPERPKQLTVYNLQLTIYNV